MQVGIHLPSWSSDHNRLPPRRLRRFTRRIEELGFTSAWVGDHIVVPESYQTGWLSPLTTLAAMSGETDTITLGTSVLLLPLRNPVLVAKQALALHHLSEGRVKLGVGMGYADADFDAVGISIEERSGRFDEAIELLYRLLHEDRVTFSGTYYSVTDVRIEPRVPRPPRILLGGTGVDRDGERVVADAVKERILHADGWIAPTNHTPRMAAGDWAEFASFLDDRGRDPTALERVVATQLHLVPNVSSAVAKQHQRALFSEHVGEKRGLSFAEQRYTLGSVPEILDELREFRDAGYDELVIKPTTHDPKQLDHQLELIADIVLPEL